MHHRRRDPQGPRSLFAPKFFSFALTAFLLLAPLASLWAQSPTVIYVNANATGNNNGQSWGNAYIAVQNALTVTNSNPGTNYEVWVAAGIYVPGTARGDSFRIVSNNVQLFGGFAGNETERDQRDWELNETILSGDINNSGQLAGNAYHVVYVDGQNGDNITGQTLIDGFTITGGNADGGFPDDAGGGLFCRGIDTGNVCSPAIANVIFSGNSATFGGAMFNYGPFSGTSSPVLTNVSFIDNSAGGGGAMYNSGHNLGTSSPILTNAKFSGNSASSGGAIWSDGSDSGTSSPILTNVSFSGNLPDAMRNTGEGTNPQVRNSVLWSNGTNSIANRNGGSATFSYSLIEGCNPDGEWNGECGTDGGNNLADADPLFVNPGQGNLRLQPASPAIDRGNNAFVNVTTDLDGNPRIFGLAVDLGPYEFSGMNCPESGVLFVDQSANESADGATWETALPELRQALLFLLDTCEIRVAEGTYLPTLVEDPANVSDTERLRAFNLDPRNLKLYGGFPPGGGTWEERNWELHETTLSGDINNSGTLESNSYQVVMISVNANDSVLDGFTISGGNAEGSFPRDLGGGIRSTALGTPLLRNLVIENNKAFFGGGLFNDGGSPDLRNVTFKNNSTNQGGAGMHSRDGAPTLTNVSFIGNAGARGSGMFNNESSPVLTNVSFVDNTATSRGGAMYNLNSSNPELQNVKFSGNSSPSGGAVYNINDSSPLLVNTTFSGNSATEGAAIYNDGNNAAQVRNSIIWGSDGDPIFNTSGGSIIASFSLIEGCNPNGDWNNDCGTDDGNNLADADPLFVDPDHGNLRLRPRSPGVDAGNNDYITAVDFDLDGNTRLFGPAVDLGAFEAEYLKIDLEIIGQGSVGVDPEPLRYDDEDVVELSATAEPNWSFEGWSGDIGTAENPAALVMTADRSITATFVIDTYDISTSADPESGGTVNCDPNPVEHGTNSSCLATANPGFEFIEWSGDCTGTGPGCVLESVTEPKSVTASFEQVGFVIEVNVEPAGAGSAQCDPNPVPEGEDSTCTAEPAPGFEFTGWSGDCEGETCELTDVTEEKSVTANFTLLDPVFQDRFEGNDDG